MILRDFECKQCGHIHEKIVESSTEFQVCPKCDDIAHKIITAGRVYLGNNDSDWVKSVLEVVDKDSNAPHTREFLKHPNRSNYKAWMKETGIRPFESGERPSKSPDPATDPHITNELMKMRRERHRLEVR